MRLHFLLALLLLIFTGGSNDFVRADQSIKAATRHGVRAPSQVTEGTQRSASVAEDETATIDEERGNPSPLIRSMSHGFEELAETAAATETVSSTSLNSLAMKALHENPSALAPPDAMSTSLESLVMKELQAFSSALADEAVVTDAATLLKEVQDFLPKVKENVAAAKAGILKTLDPQLRDLLKTPESQENFIVYFIAASQQPPDQAAIAEAFHALAQTVDMASSSNFALVNGATNVKTLANEAVATDAARPTPMGPLLKQLQEVLSGLEAEEAAMEAIVLESRGPQLRDFLKTPESQEKFVAFAVAASQKPPDQAAIAETFHALAQTIDFASFIKFALRDPEMAGAMKNDIVQVLKARGLDTEAVDSTSEDQLTTLLEMISQKDLTNPIDHAAVIEKANAVLNSPEVADALNAHMKSSEWEKAIKDRVLKWLGLEQKSQS